MWTSSIVFNFWAIFSTLNEVIFYKFCLAGSGSAFKMLLDPYPY